MIFNEHDHARLSALFEGMIDPSGDGRKNWRGEVIDPYWVPYPGYKPEVREAPNGDTKRCPNPMCSDPSAKQWRCPTCDGVGRVPNVDAGLAGKRYLHVALKYNPPAWAVEYLARAHYEACRVADALGVPAAYYPRVADGTLRVLEYPSAAHQWGRREGPEPSYERPLECDYCGTTDIKDHGVCPVLAPGAGTVEHTDFDLFTLNLWRSTPEDHEQYCGQEQVSEGREFARWSHGAPAYHLGEIGELVGLGPAVKHRVPARPYAQKSLIYFAMPDHGARLPNDVQRAAGFHAGGFDGRFPAGPTAGEWLKERVARSRYT